MIKAKHNHLYHLFFSNYFRYIIRKDFRKMDITGGIADREMPLLIIGNHFSWWDGFIPYELNRQLFRRRFHIMMLEEQLKRHLFFSKLGAFSINPGNRSAIESLNYGTSLLNDKKNLLVLFPQGTIDSQYNQSIDFKKGWFRILRNLPGPVQICFMAVLTDYFSNRKPTLFICLEEYNKTASFIFEELSEAYRSFYLKCLERQKELS